MSDNMEKRQIIIRALQKLKPNAEFSCGDDYSELTWLDETQDKPTEKEFNDAVAAERTDYNSQAYSRKRAGQYPNIGDQLDALYHAGVFPADMTAKLKKVKDDNPKG